MDSLTTQPAFAFGFPGFLGTQSILAGEHLFAELAGDLFQTSLSGKSVRNVLRRASRELDRLRIAQANAAAGIQAQVLTPCSIQVPTYCGAISSWTNAAGPTINLDGCGLSWQYDDEISYMSTPWQTMPLGTRQLGAAGIVALNLSSAGTGTQWLFASLYAPVTFVRQVVARWKAERCATKTSSKKRGKNSGRNGLSAFRRIAAGINFGAGFFGAHKVDARNIP